MDKEDLRRWNRAMNWIVAVWAIICLFTVADILIFFFLEKAIVHPVLDFFVFLTAAGVITIVLTAKKGRNAYFRKTKGGGS